MPDTAADLWPDCVLDPMRATGDPLADGVIADLFATSEVGAVNGLMRNLIGNEFAEPDTLPQSLRDYLKQTDQLPEWADPVPITAGEQVFWRFGPKIILIPICYSLPFDYLGKKGVQVLALTTRLVSNPIRRITEVAQFMVDVLQSGGLTAREGRGRRSIQKVRLMHAAVRRLAGMSPNWNPAWDLPINQEDLAGTLMSFAWIVIDGLEKLGITLSDSDRAAYLHCWLVTGYLLGVRKDMLPADADSARALAETVARRQFGPCPEGKAMTQALVDMMANILPGDVFQHVAPLFIQFFLPLRLLGIQATTLLENSAALTQVAEKVGHLPIKSLVFVERGGNRPGFAIPTELRQQWGVNWLS